MAATVAEAGTASPDSEALGRIRGRLVRTMPADPLWGWLLPGIITAVAALMRFWNLGRPKTVVFDEVYYEHDAWSLLHHGVELDKGHNDQTPGFVVHPPLGKWLIATGEGLFGHNAFGWRFAAAVVGSLSVLLIARIARRLFRSTMLGCIAGLLLAFDGLEFVQSRVAMLDIFLMFWVLAAFGCLVLDRDHGRRSLAGHLVAPGVLAGDRGFTWRPWRWACGVCLGAAAATKWSGIYWIPVFVVASVLWDWGARRTAGFRRPALDVLRYDVQPALIALVVVPVVVYIASWTGWFVSDGAHAWDHDRYVRNGQSWFAHDRAVLGGWLRYHWEIYDFHRHLAKGHPYLSRPWGWMLLVRPVSYYYNGTSRACGARSCSQEVLGVGTPALWWAAIPSTVYCAWRWLARRDWRAGIVVAALLAGYLPWFLADRHHRTMFLFYAMPMVPFMVLAVTAALGAVLGRGTDGVRRGVAATVVGLYLVAVILNFAWLRPVLAGDTITYDQWHSRMLFTTCDTSKHRNEHLEDAPCWI